jgi:hypothetical protein
MKIGARIVPVSIAFAFLAAVLSIPALASQSGHFDRTLTVSGPVDLDVQTGSGNISVHVGDSSSVVVHAEIRAHGGWHDGDIDKRIQEIESNPPIEQNGNTIRVGHFNDHELTRDISISYELAVPASTKLHSASGSGDESIEGISGPLDSTSGSGSLHASNINAETRMNTGSGDIELRSIHGSVEAKAGSGSIRADGIAGGLTASSGSGNITLEQTAAGDVEISTGSGTVEVKGVNGAVHITTGSGNIVAEGQPARDWKLRTGSGNVTAEFPAEAAFTLHAHTSSGQIETSHELVVQGNISPRELQGKAHGGGALVDMSTSSGTIEIR